MDGVNEIRRVINTATVSVRGSMLLEQEQVISHFSGSYIYGS